MGWELVLLSASGAVALGSATLMGIIYLLDKKPYLGLWSMSWFLFLVSTVTLMVKNGTSTSQYHFDVYLYMLFSLMQFIGARSYAGFTLGVRPLLLTVGAALLLTSGLHLFIQPNYFLTVMNILVAAVIWTTAWTTLHVKWFQNHLRGVIFILFLILGFHQLSQNLYMGANKDLYIWYGMHLLLIMALSPLLLWDYLKSNKEEMGTAIDRYETIFHQNHAIMLLIDPIDTRIVDCNKAAVTFYGYDMDTLKTMKMQQINQAGPVLLQENIKKTIESESVQYHFQHRLADGSIRDVEVLAGPLKSKGKTMILSIIRDDTENVRVTRMSEAQKALLALGNQAPEEQSFLQGVLQQVLTLGELSFIAMYYFPRGQAEGIVQLSAAQTDKELLRISGERVFIDAAIQSVQDGTACHVPDLSLKKSTFSILPQTHVQSLLIEPVFRSDVFVGALVVGSPKKQGIEGLLENFMGSLSLFIGYTLRRLNADLLVAQTENRWRFALDEIGDLVLDIGVDGDIKYPSANTEKFLGYALRDMPKHLDGWMQLVHPEDRPTVEKAMIEEARHGQAYAIEHRLRKKDGEFRWFMHRGCVMRGANDDRNIVMAILTDIHAKREFAVELQRTKEALEQSNHTKSQFLANMSHELRTPMNGIFGMLQLLEISQMDADQRENLHIMRDSSKRMMGLIDNIITFTTIEGGYLLLNEGTFDIGKTIRAIAEEYRHDIEAKELKLNLDISDKLPSDLFGDSEKIGVILHQWMDNAVKFTDAGSITVTLRPDVPKAGTRGYVPVLLTVADTGIGISKSELPSLFNNFTQADHAYTRISQGAGLGLAICRIVGEILGASFEVDSAPSEGAVFKMRLRLKRALNEPIVQDHKSGLVLIVDDDEVSRRLLGLFCEKADMTVQFASNGREAIQKSREQCFDLVFMDIQMPDMSGLEAAKIIRIQSTGQDHEPNIIAVTAYALKGDQERFLNEGMDDYLSKPIDSGQLYGLIKKWMTKRRSALH